MSELNFNDLPCDIKQMIFNTKPFRHVRHMNHFYRIRYKTYFNECMYNLKELSKGSQSPKDILENINYEWTFEDENAMMDNDPTYIPEPRDDWF